MSVINRVKTALGGKAPPNATPVPASIEMEKRLDAARAEIERLQIAHADAAYLAVTGDDPNEVKRTAELAQQIRDTAASIETLIAAIGVARRREADALAEERVAKNEKLVKDVERTLERAAVYANDLAEAIRIAVKLHQLLVMNAERAAAAYPALAAPATLNVTAINGMVADEIFRIGHGPFIRGVGIEHRRGFPGARPSSVDYVDQPEAITPLTKQISDGNAYALRVLKDMIGQGWSGIGDFVASPEPEASTGVATEPVAGVDILADLTPPPIKEPAQPIDPGTAAPASDPEAQRIADAMALVASEQPPRKRAPRSSIRKP